MPSGWEQPPSNCSLCCKSDLSHPSQLPVTSVQSRNLIGHSTLSCIIPLAKSKLATLQVTSFHPDLPVPVCPTVPFSWELLPLHIHVITLQPLAKADCFWMGIGPNRDRVQVLLSTTPPLSQLVQKQTPDQVNYILL